MKIARIALAPLALSIIAACASSNTASTTQGTGVGGPGATGAVEAPDTNPQGVAYPTDHIGTNARSGTPGDRIANFKFLGYPNSDISNGLKPISLADYYDPTGNTFKLIHIQASGTWCPHCANEIKAATPIASQLASMKVVWLVSLAEGASVGTPSNEHDLQQWITDFQTPFTEWLDPGNKNLGPFYDDNALPWNGFISAKTMEILTSGVGATETSDAIMTEVNQALAMVDATGGLPVASGAQ